MSSAIVEVHLFWVKLWSVQRIKQFTYGIRRRRARRIAHGNRVSGLRSDSWAPERLPKGVRTSR